MEKQVNLAEVETHADGTRRIVRDRTFARISADRVYVIPLSSDIELACVQNSPELKSETNDGELAFEPVRVEVARLRVSMPGAVSVAMNILNHGISSGVINGPAVLNAISEWVKEEEEETGYSEEGEATED